MPLRAILIFVLLLLPLSAHARTEWQPRIISRSEWGADERAGIASSTREERGTAAALRQARPSQLSEKERKCREAAAAHPEDFAVSTTVTHDASGKPYVWPQRYSENVKLLVVHHTGEHEHSSAHDLFGEDRVRSIYHSHAVSNGWGDIGYHYLIDRAGVIYEGRAGGKGVVGAHVYCANVGTISIAMIGNFQRRSPTTAQLQSLRWLLIDQAQEYGLNPRGRIAFQGKRLPTIVSHRDLSPTQCAGRFVQSALSEVRLAVAQRDYTRPLLASTYNRQQSNSLNVSAHRSASRSTDRLSRRVRSRVRQYLRNYGHPRK